MSIEWASVNWVYVALLSGFTFIAALIGNYISFRNRVIAAVLAAVLFAAIFNFRNVLSPRHSSADVESRNLPVPITSVDLAPTNPKLAGAFLGFLFKKESVERTSIAGSGGVLGLSANM